MHQKISFLFIFVFLFSLTNINQISASKRENNRNEVIDFYYDIIVKVTDLFDEDEPEQLLQLESGLLLEYRVLSPDFFHEGELVEMHFNHDKSQLFLKSYNSISKHIEVIIFHRIGKSDSNYYRAL